MTSAPSLTPVALRQAGQLTAKIYANRRELGEAAGLEMAQRVKQLLDSQRKATVVFAAAPSQNEFLDTLAGQPDIDWKRVVAMHMDEYVGLPEGAPQGFGTYLKEHIFGRVHPGEVHYLNGNAPDAGAECRRYAQLLRDNPVDIVCGGIGENGHLAFNDPAVADFVDPVQVKVVELDRVCRQQQVNDGCFSAVAEVPTLALTLTIPAMLMARWITCAVPGPTKTQAVTRTMTDPIDGKVPATVLRIHPRAVLYLDEDSAAGLADQGNR
jgi:glucosamine-6-phosphate deaminase